MINEVIKGIRTVEEKGDGIIIKAKEEAEKTIEDTELKMEKIIKDAEAEAKAESKTLLAKTIEETQKEIEILKAKNSEETQKIRKAAEQKIDKVVSIAMEEIVS